MTIELGLGKEGRDMKEGGGGLYLSKTKIR
jgi:hypothetical protein